MSSFYLRVSLYRNILETSGYVSATKKRNAGALRLQRQSLVNYVIACLFFLLHTTLFTIIRYFDEGTVVFDFPKLPNRSTPNQGLIGGGNPTLRLSCREPESPNWQVRIRLGRTGRGLIDGNSSMELTLVLGGFYVV